MKIVIKHTSKSYVKPGAFAPPGMAPQKFMKSIGFECVKTRWVCTSLEQAARFIYRNVFIVRYKGTMYIFNSSTGCYEPVDGFNLPSVIRTVVNQKKYAGIEPWTESLNKDLTFAIKSFVSTEVIEFNSTEYAVFENCAYNTKTFQAENFSPNHYSTRKIDCSYQPEADCPLFKKFIADVTCGQKDLQLQLQQIVGYLLVNHNKAEKSFLIIGPARNGKSTFATVIRDLLGRQNVSATPLKRIGTEFGLEDMAGKMVNITTESSKGELVNSAYWKSLTSGDDVLINGKGKVSYSARLTTKMISCLNYLPSFEELDSAVRRRLMIIPFVAQISEADADPDLLQKLIKEKSGILNWALDGMKSLAANNWHFTESESSQQMLNDYITSTDDLSRFIEECVTADVTADKIQLAVIRQKYNAWAQKMVWNSPVVTDLQKNSARSLNWLIFHLPGLDPADIKA